MGGATKGENVVQEQPRRVALIASSFHPHTGGVETHVRAVARELAAAGDVVEVWTVDRGEHLGQDVVDGITVRYLPTPLPARDARALARFAVAAPGALVLWWRAMRSLRPGVLHVHCFGPNGIYALALHRLTGTRLVVTSHGETFADDHDVFGKSALLRASLRRAVARATAVTAPSHFVLDDLRQRFGLLGGQVVPNGVDLEAPIGALSSFPSGRVVFAAGRLERMKGFDLLLDVVNELPATDVQVVIGGDGVEAANLREQADRLGVSERVHLVGRLSGAEIAAAMHAADVVIVPSRYEAFGIVALEAWRAGTPLIGSCHGGMPEFVTDGEDGLIVDPTDAGQLVDALSRVLDDRALADRLSASARVRVRNFTWLVVVECYQAVYHAKIADP